MNELLPYQEERWEELIDGKVVLMSPSPVLNHNLISSNIYSAFRNYLRGKTCTPLADGVDLYLSDKERYIPDMMVVCDRDKLKKNGVHGTPDLVVEVLSPRTAQYDRGHKKKVYERSGVREYWIVSPGDMTVEQYLLRDGVLELDTVCIHPEDTVIEKMSEEEKAQVPTAVKCSLYEALTISLADIFEGMI